MAYQWQGIDVSVEFGYASLIENKRKPLLWYHYEVQTGKVPLPAILVHYRPGTNGHSFVIANHHGIGVAKLMSGGWPDLPHFSVPADSFTPDDQYARLEFDGEAYQAHETARRSWQEEKYGHTDAWKKVQALRNIAQNKIP